MKPLRTIYEHFAHRVISICAKSFPWWFDSARARRVLVLTNLATLAALALVLHWGSKVLHVPTDWNAEALSYGDCPAGRHIEVYAPKIWLDDWCCTSWGDEMTFINTKRFEYGNMETMVAFGGVSFITGMKDALAPLDQKAVTISGIVSKYNGKCQIVINSPDQVQEANRANERTHPRGED